MITKCSCQVCDGGLEFEADDLCEENSWIACPHCGSATELWVPEPMSVITPLKDQLPVIRIPGPMRPHPDPPNAKKPSKSRLPYMTAETIRVKTKTGNTPLHRAAKEGRIHEIPCQLLEMDLFLTHNKSGQTPVDLAAANGHLDQIPHQFLTKETLANSVLSHYTGSGYLARRPTALHIAVYCGHADQIPKEFFTPEFLSIPATGYRTTLLHDLACIDRLDLVPASYAGSEMWNLQNWRGETPREMVRVETPG